MEDQKTRRHWLRTAAMGSAVAAGLGEFGCSGQNKEAPAAAKLATTAPLAPAPALQIICHGMLHFNLKPADGVMEIVVPKVNGHVYIAGSRPSNPRVPNLAHKQQYSLTVSGFNPTNPLPSGLEGSSNVFIRSNNKCGGHTVLPGAAHCTIIVPMPDEYKGYKTGKNATGGALFLAGGKTVKCSPELGTLASIKLVHVFRYSAATTATLNPPVSPAWPGPGENKLFIFAGPPVGHPPSNDHLTEFGKLFAGDFDLQFRTPKDLTSDPVPGADSDVVVGDLKPLYDTVIKGGSPADCISTFDDGGS